MNIWKLISLVLTIFLITLIFFNFNQTTLYRSQHKSEFENFVKKDDTLNFYKLNYSQSVNLDGVKILDVICKKNEETTVLSNLLNKTPILIYRFTDKECTSCIEEILTHVTKKFFVKKDRIIILCSFTNELSFLTIKKALNIRIPLYEIPENAFEEFLKDNKHFFFVLHPDMKISHIFVPNSDYFDQSRSYIDGVARFLLE